MQNRVMWGLLVAVAVGGVMLVAHYQSRLPRPQRSVSLSRPRDMGTGGVMDERLVKLLEPMRKRPGASEAALERLRKYVGTDLPPDCLEFLRWSDGVSGVMPTPRRRIAELGGVGPEGYLHSVEEAIEQTKAWEDLRPGYLFLGAFNDSSLYLLLDIWSGDPNQMVYLLADSYWHEGQDEEQESKPYRAASLYDLLHHLATHQVYLDADLRSADLRQLDLSEVYFVSSPLAGADLRGADLRGAVLDCDLTGTNLAGADLRGALLHGADLTGANLADARLTGTMYDHTTRWPKGFDPKRHGAVADR